MSFKFTLNPVKYEDVRTEIVNFLNENSEFSNQFDFTSSNIGLIIDSMAYVTMLMAYQVSNTANNLFLDSTTIRKNAVSIAKTMGYRPQRSIASRVTGTLMYIDPTTDLTGKTVTIPVYNKFISDTGYTYINFSPIVLESVDANTLKASVILYEGALKTYTYVGNGNPFQIFIIPSKKIAENNFELKVRKNNEINGILWNEVKDSFNMLDLNSYFVEEDLNSEGYARIVFGDKYITNYPSNTEIVDVQYLETNAELANNSQIINIITDGITEYTVSNFNSANLSTSLSLSYGGTPIETLEIIKERAAKKYATVGRAVTQNDYTTLLSNHSYILKANSIGGDTLFPGDPHKLGNIYLTAVPIIQNMNKDFYTSNYIYLNEIHEDEIINTLNRYRIISTYLSFLKPSYISIDIAPTIEVDKFTSPIEIERIKTNVYNALNDYALSLTEFSPSIRYSKINGIISDTNGVISSSFVPTYSFAITKESFYYPNTDNNIIFLPIMYDGVNYSNFVKTNTEQMLLSNITYPQILPIEDRTIYGKINTLNNERYLYNEDVIIDGIVQTCDLKINGLNYFFDMYRFDSNLLKNNIPDTSKKTFNINGVSEPFTIISNVVSSGDYTYDNYTLSIGPTIFGTIERTYNRSYGYAGLISTESDISNNTHGTFYRSMCDINITGIDKAFNKLVKDDVIIYNAEVSGAKWVMANYLGEISAETDHQLFNKLVQNTIYEIEDNTSGDFNGRTPVVSGDDAIMFNLNSSSVYHWDKLNLSNLTFDASTPIVIEAVDYEIKKIINLGYASTTFDGRTNTNVNLIDNDLIYYDPITNSWPRIGNSSVNGSIYQLPVVDADPPTGGSLEGFNDGNTALGTTFVVQNIGSFGTSMSYVNWKLSEEVAYDGDVIIYIGNGRWNIWQESATYIYYIDGTITSALPLRLTTADKFLVTTAGNFTVSDGEEYQIGDYIVYVGLNDWVKYIAAPIVLNPSSYLNLPGEATIGDMYKVTTDGVFEYSYMISPNGDSFIEGDFIIYNGSTYTKLNEYTFKYAYIDIVNPTGKEYLNSLGFNSVFYYTYDYDTKYFRFYFNDIYHDQTIGSFRYDNLGSTSIDNLYDTSKITFEKSITGSYNYNDTVSNVSLRDLFDDTTVNKIYFKAKNQLDLNGNITTIEETDFDSNFNTFIIMNILTPQVK